MVSQGAVQGRGRQQYCGSSTGSAKRAGTLAFALVVSQEPILNIVASVGRLMCTQALAEEHESTQNERPRAMIRMTTAVPRMDR